MADGAAAARQAMCRHSAADRQHECIDVEVRNRPVPCSAAGGPQLVGPLASAFLPASHLP